MSSAASGHKAWSLDIVGLYSSYFSKLLPWHLQWAEAVAGSCRVALQGVMGVFHSVCFLEWRRSFACSSLEPRIPQQRWLLPSCWQTLAFVNAQAPLIAS